MYKKFKVKHVFTLILILALCTGLFTGCGGSNVTSNQQKPTDNSTANTPRDNSSTTPPPSAAEPVVESDTSGSTETTTKLGKPVTIYENDDFKLTAVEVDMETIRSHFSDDVNKNFIDAAFDMINEAPLSREISEVGGCAYIDSSGNIAFTLLGYKRTHAFSEGLAAVMKYDEWAGADVWGFIDTMGNEAIKCEYEEVSDFSEGLVAVKKDGKWGYIDTKGNVVIPIEYEGTGGSDWRQPTDFHDGRAWVWVSYQMWNIIDTSGNKIGEPMDKRGDFSEGLASIRVENKWRFVDISGKDIGIVVQHPYSLAKDYNSIHGFSEGLCAVYNNDTKLWGFIDKSGALVIEPQYEHVTNFKNGLAGVSKNSKWGVINKKGEMIIPYKITNPYSDPIRGLDTGLFVSNKTDMPNGAGISVEMITDAGEVFTVEFPGFNSMYTPRGFKNNFAVWRDVHNGFNIRFLIIEKIVK